jgi:hypothetical protein
MNKLSTRFHEPEPVARRRATESCRPRAAAGTLAGRSEGQYSSPDDRLSGERIGQTTTALSPEPLHRNSPGETKALIHLGPTAIQITRRGIPARSSDATPKNHSGNGLKEQAVIKPENRPDIRPARWGINE